MSSREPASPSNPVERFVAEVERITSEHCDADKPDGWPDDSRRKEIGRGLSSLGFAAERWIADTNPEDDGTATGIIRGIMSRVVKMVDEAFSARTQQDNRAHIDYLRHLPTVAPRFTKMFKDLREMAAPSLVKPGGGRPLDPMLDLHLADLVAKVHTRRCQVECARLKGIIQRAAKEVLAKPPKYVLIDVPGYPRRLCFRSGKLDPSHDLYSDDEPPSDIVKEAERNLRVQHEAVQRAANGDVTGLLVFCGVVDDEPVFNTSQIEANFSLALQVRVEMAKSPAIPWPPARLMWNHVEHQIAKRFSTPIMGGDLMQYAEAVASGELGSNAVIRAEIGRLDRDGFTAKLIADIEQRFPEEAAAMELPIATRDNNGDAGILSAPASTAAEQDTQAIAQSADEAARLIGDEWATYQQLASVTDKSESAIRSAFKRAKDSGELLADDEQEITDTRPGSPRCRFRIRGVWRFLDPGGERSQGRREA